MQELPLLAVLATHQSSSLLPIGLKSDAVRQRPPVGTLTRALPRKHPSCS